jgi:glyoxylase-like metal-dependent hydrolase (beta-lactamase superfamily II)
MVDVKEVVEKIYLIDNKLYSIPKWGSVYLINEERKALIDPGPTTSANTVLEGIRKAGVRPEDIDYLIATHIHLDHAGGAGVLVRNMPRARVVVHHKGAKHLANPAKLVSSVMAAMGEEMMRKCGEVVPVEEERIKPVREGDSIEMGDKQVLRFIEAPGHASHELCIHESRNNGLFSGDAIGVSVADNEVLIPVTPPPSFDLEVYLQTLRRLKTLKASAIYYAHFGVSNKVAEDLKLAMDKLKSWADIVVKALDEDGFDSAAKKLRAQLYLELEPVRKAGSLYKYLTSGIVALNVAGYIKYYQNKNEAN